MRGDFQTLLIGAFVSLAGLIYGLDTGSIGPVTQMRQFNHSIADLSSTQQGIFVASILLASSASSLVSGRVADAISRRYSLLAGASLCLVGTITSSAAPNLAALVVARILTGLGLGQSFSVTNVYLIELAPKHIRGVAACMLQTYVVLGITVGYFVSFGSQKLEGSMAWRTPFVVQAACAFVLAAGAPLLPYSPRWLLQKGRVDEARGVLSRLRGEDGAERELREIQEGLDSHDSPAGAPGWLEMFRRPYLDRTLLAVFLMACQQLTGIDVALYYAPILFKQAGFSSQQASFFASGVSGIVMLVATIPAQIWVDRWGRRKPLVIGGGLMAASLLVIGALYARYGVEAGGEVTMRSTAGKWAVTVLTYIFVVNFSWSWAVVAKVYVGEMMPTRTRANVMAVALLSNWLVNFAVALTAPLFLRASPSGPYFTYGAVTLLAALVCTLLPETKGRSLEEIDREFRKRAFWKTSSAAAGPRLDDAMPEGESGTGEDGGKPR